MGILQPGLWIEGSADHHAQPYRLLLEMLTAGAGGVWPQGTVVAETTGAEMKVKVLGGRHFLIPRTAAAHQGSSGAYNDGDVVLDVDAADPDDPRIDLVVIRVNDAAMVGTPNTDDTTFEIITGTPNASPQVPDAPDDALALATIDVGAGASFVSNNEITPLTTGVAALGGTTVCTSTTRPSSPITGQMIWETDTDFHRIWNGSQWRVTRGKLSDAGSGGDLAGGAGVWNGSGVQVTLPPGRWLVTAQIRWSWSMSGSGQDLSSRLRDTTAGVTLGETTGFRTQASTSHPAPGTLVAEIDVTSDTVVEVEGEATSTSGTQFQNVVLAAIAA